MVIIQSLERAFAILRALAVKPARISELATIVPPAQEHRRPDAHHPRARRARSSATRPIETYRIGEGLAQLAAPMDFTTSLVVSIKPHLAQLSSAIGEAAGFSVPEGYAMHYLVQVDSARPIQVRTTRARPRRCTSRRPGCA